VYVLRGIAKSTAYPPDLDLWESIGHVLGAATSLAVVLLAPRAEWAFAVAACVAGLVGLVAPRVLTTAVST
jgi:hypothetical protein